MAKKSSPLYLQERQKLEGRLQLVIELIDALAVSAGSRRRYSYREGRELAQLMMKRDRLRREIGADNAKREPLRKFSTSSGVASGSKSPGKPSGAKVVIGEQRPATGERVALKPEKKKKSARAKRRSKALWKSYSYKQGARRSGGVGAYGFGPSIRNWP